MSGRRIADLLIKIGADSYEFQSKSQQVQSDLDKFGKKVDKIGKELSLKLTAPLAALGAVSVAMFDDSARAMAKVEQGIKSTGGAAQLSSAQFAKLASELQNKTLFENDFILNNATAQLLTFTNIAGENFKRAQAVALDLATVLDSDLKGASIQLGKALNDPVRSLSALRKSGIQFSDEQEAVIKKLAATGDMAKAQSLMLTELERQYGGQAEAAAKVGAGSLKQLKNSWGDFLEQIGAAIMPALNALVDTLKKVVNWLQNLSPEVKTVTVVIGGLLAAIGPTALAFGGMLKMLPMIKAGFALLLNPITLVIVAVGVLVTAMYKLKNATAEAMDRWKTETMSAKKWTVDEAVEAYENSNRELSRLKGERESIVSKLNSYRANSEESGISYGDANSLRKQLGNVTGLIKAQENLVASRLQFIDDVKNQAKEMEDVGVTTGNFKTALEELGVSEDLISDKSLKASGVISKLSEKMAEMEKAKANAMSTDDVAALNSQIEALRKQIDGLNQITKNYIDNRKLMANIGEAGGTASVGGKSVDVKVAPVTLAPKIKVNPIVEFIKSANEIGKKVSDYIASIYGNGGIEANAVKMGLFIKKQIEKNIEQGFTLEESTNNVVTRLEATRQRLAQTIDNFMGGLVSSMADSIGSIAVGDMGFDQMLFQILSEIGGFIKQLGIELLMVSGIMIAFKKAIAALMATPWIAAGVAALMIGVGAILQASMNKKAQQSVPKLANGGLAYAATYAMVGDNPNARVDPEVIAPLSKLKQIMKPNVESSSLSNVKFVIEGDVLVGILNKYSKKLKYT